MWGAAPMIGEGMYPGARTIWRANRFSAISLITNAFSGVIQTDLSSTPLLTTLEKAIEVAKKTGGKVVEIHQGK